MVRRFPKLQKKPKGLLPWKAPVDMRKQIFLPNFTIGLLRTPFLPPRFASFIVPLNLNKLDLRDYLRRLYGVRVISIRSYVQIQPLTRQKPDGSGYGSVRRPKSIKKMTVELKEPFVWPDEPTDLSPWEKENYYQSQEYGESKQKKLSPEAGREPDKQELEAIEEQAKQITQGEQVWKPTWQALGLNYDRSAVGASAGVARGPSSSSSSSSSGGSKS